MTPGGEPVSRAEWAASAADWFPELVDAKARSLTFGEINEHRDRIVAMLVWLSRTGARCQSFVLVRFPGPLAEPDVQLPPHPALHEPVGLCGRDRVPSIPWRRDLRSPVAVTGDRDCAGVEELQFLALGPAHGMEGVRGSIPLSSTKSL